MKELLIILSICILLPSCAKKKKPAIVYYDYSDNDTELYTSDIISVPYQERGGVKYVNVKVNGMGVEMIFDTGCSGTLISIAEANYLYEKGLLADSDFLGYATSQIADGSIVEDMVVNLREIIIADQIVCHDVEATVSKNANAPLLLGNEVLDRAVSYTINNQNSTIDFKLR